MAGILHVERRNTARRTVSVPLLFSFNNRIVNAHAVDLSDTGMRVQSIVEPNAGAKLVIGFAPSADIETHHAEGQVIWVAAPQTPGGLYTWGFFFDNLGPDTAAYIRGVLADAVELGAAEPSPTASSPGGGAASEILPSAADIQKAIATDSEARVKKQNDADALVSQAAKACAEQKYAEAETLLMQALTLLPESRAINEELARILYLRGDVARAGELFDKALRLEEK